MNDYAIPMDLSDDEEAAGPAQILHLARYPQAPDALFSRREDARDYCDEQHRYRNPGPAAAVRWVSSEHGWDEQFRAAGGASGGVVTVLTVDAHLGPVA